MWIRSVLVGVLLLSAATGISAIDGVSSEIRESLVNIRINAKNKKTGQPESFRFTGFIVYADGYLLTSQKLLPPSSDFSDITITGTVGAGLTEYPLEIISEGPEGDFALLKFRENTGSFSCVSLGGSYVGPVSGLEVVALGFSLRNSSMELHSSQLVLNREKAADTYVTQSVLDGPSISGSPVFDSQKKLVGMVSVVYPDKKSTDVIPIHRAVPLLSKLPKWERYHMDPPSSSSSAPRELRRIVESRVLPEKN
jgi:S1-C subfamily serine protease